MLSRPLVLVAFAALAIVSAGTIGQAQTPPGPPAATPPPPPLPNANRTAGPVLSPGPAQTVPAGLTTPTAAPAEPRRGKNRSTPVPEPSASESPAPPQFTTLDGVWELEIQPLVRTGKTIYEHWRLTQQGETVSGTWMVDGNRAHDVALRGSFDGRLFSLDARSGGKSYTFSGYVENLSDMVGLMKSSDPKDLGVPFTAEHRKKERVL